MKTRELAHFSHYNCDFCHVEPDILIDGKTVYGPWALMCQKCHMEVGVGLGIGKGQQYLRKEEGIYVAV